MTSGKKVLLLSSSPFAPIPANSERFEDYIYFNNGQKASAFAPEKNFLHVRQTSTVVKSGTFRIFPHLNPHISRIKRVGWPRILDILDPDLDKIELADITPPYPSGKSPMTGYALPTGFIEKGLGSISFQF